MTTALAAVLMLLPAMAGYGDVDENGLPSWAERDVHIWTNAVRVDPEAFSADYEAGGCSFSSFLPAEQVKLPPLGYDRGLNDASRFHCQDMSDNNHFAHESSDGTSFGDRVGRYYDTPFAGENIATGYPTGYVAVLQGWMCSDGHRANIMLDGYQELGTGVVGTYYTQDFGGGDRNWDHPFQMGSHDPGTANHEATFLGDWYASEGPAVFQVVIDGVPFDLALTYGDAEQGVYTVDAEPEPVECHQYYFYWEEADGTSAVFPEDGSYTYGEDCDDALGWVAGHTDFQGGGSGGSDDGGGGGANGLDTEGNPLSAGVPKLTGCSALGAGSVGVWALVIAMLGVRRRD